MLKVAHLCESFGMNWEPHAYGGTMYQAANLHVILAVKNCALFEFPIHHGQVGCWDVGTTDVIRIDSEGYVHGPTKPGLGIEIDWEQVEARARVADLDVRHRLQLQYRRQANGPQDVLRHDIARFPT